MLNNCPGEQTVNYICKAFFKFTMRKFNIIGAFFLLCIVFAACQKDQDITAANKIDVKGDSINNRIAFNSPDNFLATSGTLTVRIEDSTYVFDAAKDSVAFVNVKVDSTHYFGITAINKAHTRSFGISSEGIAAAEVNNPVAGTQLLLNHGDKGGQQFTLPENINIKDVGKLNIIRYMQDSTLSQGTFYTILSKQGQRGPNYFRVTGSFRLQLKQ